MTRPDMMCGKARDYARAEARCAKFLEMMLAYEEILALLKEKV